VKKFRGPGAGSKRWTENSLLDTDCAAAGFPEKKAATPRKIAHLALALPGRARPSGEKLEWLIALAAPERPPLLAP
jgi:hypothetical protein